MYQNTAEDDNSDSTTGESNTEDISPPETELTPINSVITPGQIGFSEVMYAEKNSVNTVVQWIELYNKSNGLVDMSGWKLEIETRDEDDQHRFTEIYFNNLQISDNGTVLLITMDGRKSTQISDEIVYNLFTEHSTEFDQIEPNDNLFGSKGFFLQLSTPEGVISDVVGNLDGDSSTEDEPAWELSDPLTVDGARSSIMRRYSVEDNLPLNGRKKVNWVLSSNLPLSISTFLGSNTDHGNPGHRIASPLPVELSTFSVELSKEGIRINWTTESEIDNAGFNILRSERPNGQYRIINDKLIQGAGTSGERNSYLWIDTTTTHDIEYHYKIQDVSFAGETQILATQRMKGIISPKHRFTTSWGDIKEDK